MERVNLATIKQAIAEMQGVIKHIDKQPLDKELSIAQTAKDLSLAPLLVKTVFYVLLASREIKATFLPVHYECGQQVGRIETSVYTITHKAKNGEYVCCGNTIEGDDIEIQMVFWRLGSKAIKGGD